MEWIYRFVECIPDGNCFSSVWNVSKLFLSIVFPSLMIRKGSLSEGRILRPEFVDLTEDVTLLFSPLNPAVRDGRMPWDFQSKSRNPASWFSEPMTQSCAGPRPFSSKGDLSLKVQDRIRPSMIRKLFIRLFGQNYEKSAELLSAVLALFVAAGR